MKTKNYFKSVVLFTISLLFVYTGISKLADIPAFSASLQKSILIPAGMVGFISIALPLLEIALPLLFLFKKTGKASIYIALLSMCVFTLYTILLYYFSPDIPCSCGGIVDSLSWPAHIFINVFLTAMLLILSRKIKLFALSVVLFFSISLQAQTNIQKSIFIKEKSNNNAVGYAVFSYTLKKDTTKKKREMRANEKGIIDFSGLSAIENDTIFFELISPGYQIYRDTANLKSIYLRTFYVEPSEEHLKDVTVSANVHNNIVKPNEIQIAWNRYKNNDADPLLRTIAKIPFVINKSINPNEVDLSAIGGKKLIIYLDGRRLSEAEIKAIPSTMVSKASLVTFPSAVDAARDEAVLYLTSKNYAYTFSYQEIDGNYAMGSMNGPSLTFRHTQKKGLWSNNVLLSGYVYEFAPHYGERYWQENIFQKDSGRDSRSRSLIFNTYVTREGLKKSLLTFGLVGNFVGSKQKTGTWSLSDHNNLYADDKTTYDYINATFIANWRKVLPSGSVLLVNGNAGLTPLRKNLFEQYSAGSYTVPEIYSLSNQRSWTAGASAKYAIQKKKLQKANWDNSFTIGYRYTLQRNEIENNSKQTQTSNIFTNSEQSVYAGYSTKIVLNKLSFEASAVGNYALQYGFAQVNYKSAYLYPRIVASYTFNDAQSLSFSFSAPVYRPSLYMLSDSSVSSSWLINEGNSLLKAEKNLDAELVYTSSMDKFTLQGSFRQDYSKDGIVTALLPGDIARNHFINTYLNRDFVKRSFSMLMNIAFTKKFSVKVEGSVVNVLFHDDKLPDMYRKPTYIKGRINVDYVSKMGYFNLMFNYDPRNIAYMQRTEKGGVLDISYEKELRKNLTAILYINDVLGDSRNKKAYYASGLNSFNYAKGRNINIGFRWLIGEQFFVKSAGTGTGDAIPADTKK
ncbi:outer membrane beta-barrel family protein [Haoranjiania flava]|uniref:Outer membrane beta-barrel family protein n=1 Tax=Haoranjiania flava TaxID=1856322 RepID=A0AAE3LJJ5_9BACT|nr:outer membrane beta-barrel family protein [Haoranjiania flava]MCU7693449.1 outer membrane beta-barrel family protein [Haoranjiania flava]